MASVFFPSESAIINPRWSKEPGWRKNGKRIAPISFEHDNVHVSGGTRVSFIVLKDTFAAFHFTFSFQINSNCVWQIGFYSNNLVLVVISFLL